MSCILCRAARDYRANWKKYAIMAAALLGVLMLELVLLRIQNKDVNLVSDIRYMVGLNFGFIMTACMVIFTISVMKPMKSRHTLAVESTVPASVFEKYLFLLLSTTAGVCLQNALVRYSLPGIINTGMGGMAIMACLAAAAILLGWVAAWFNFRERSAK